MSKPRSQKLKTELSLNDEPSILTQFLEGTDPESLPFPEWSDQDINLEKWDNIHIISKFQEKSSRTNLNSNVFEDPQEVHLPPSLGAHQWKRCSEIFPDANFSIFVNKPTYPDLVTPNYHILISEFYRSFISSIETLLYISSSKPFPEEYGSSAYYAPVDRAWRPWHHIYSNCKIVKGHSEHTPLYNPVGKYVVRLYWMGSWRKIYVDDLIPVDRTNAVLLPTLSTPKVKSQPNLIEVKPEKRTKDKPKAGGHIKKETVELWPMILCKALLKIGALSWSTQQELHDCDIINCLTGWIPQRIKAKDISSSDLWDIFMAYVERFQWEEEKEGSTKNTASSKSKTKAKGAEKAEVTKKGTKGAKAAFPSGIENMQDGDRFIVVSCDNFETNVELDKISQNKNIGVFISQVRDIPFIKPPPRPELEFWKTFRYEKWAVERGIIPPDIPKLNIKSLKIADPFKRIFKDGQEIEELENKTQVTADTENTDKKSEKSSKSSKNAPHVKVPKSRLEPDPTMWIDFDEIKSNIGYINIYFQPRGFKARAKISDINFQNKTVDYKHIMSPIDLKESRNEPIYMFMDSIDYKFLLINYTQIGNVFQLEKLIEPSIGEPTIANCTDVRDICVDIILHKTEEKDSTTQSLSQISNKSTLMCSFNTKPINFVLEEYCWDTNVFGEVKGMTQTYGNISVMMDLKPGRKSFRLWISSHCSYVLQVFSDTPMTIGYQEEYIIACTAESQLLTNLCFELSSCFGKLIQSFGMPDYSISLRNFYHCYKPFENLTKSELVAVHRVLLEEFCKVISNNNPSPSVLGCVRLLFLQLKTFNYINPYQETSHLCPNDLFTSVQIDYAKKMEWAAVKLQAFFKGVYIRLVMKKLNENHKQYYSIFDTLKKVYSEIFSSDKRLNYCPKLFRKFFERKEMEKLKEKFEVYRDMKSVVNNQVFTNSIVVHESGWVPMCRYEFHINCIEPVKIKTSLFCNLKNYYVRVFNNDTEKEIKRYTNNAAVEKYETNVHGYTIICYGWVEENAKLNWKLKLTTKKMSRHDLVVIPSIPTTTISLKDYYMPNFHNIICRYIIKANPDTFLTAHLRTSYDQVKVLLKLMDSKGKILYETGGVGSALLPVLHLQSKNEANESLLKLIPGTSSKKRLSSQSGLNEITYNKLSKKYSGTSENASSRSSSQKKVSVGSEGQETGTKRHRRRSLSESIDGDDDISNSSQPSERPYESNGKHTRRSKARQSEPSEGESISERSSKKSSLKSKSFEKLNQRSFSQGKNRGSGSRQGTLNKLVENNQIEYILEGTVLKDSWPLTGDEWNRIRQLKEKSYLYLPEERKNSYNKKNLINKRMEEPYWVLDLVHAAEDLLEYEQDCSKSKKRKQIKMSWFENPERYQRGFELREIYLQENLVFNTNVITEKYAVRSNNPKDFAPKIIEEPPIEQFMILPLETVDEDSCKTKSSEDYLINESNVERTLREYKSDEQAIREDTEELLQDQIKKFEILRQWFSEVRNDSVEMISEAIKLEKDFVKKYLESTAKGKGDKKDKEKKKK